MGNQAYKQVLKDPEVNISQNPETVALVKQVADRVIQAAKKSKYSEKASAYEWDVSVIQNDKTLNAFALPGGKIAIYTGIFPVAKNTAGLAAIMGHEVVHALARHGAERMSQGLVTQAGLTAAAIALQTQGLGGVGGQSIMSALGVGAQVGVVLPFSREHESEADYIGLLLAAEAGYDPREAVRVWQRMKHASEGQQPEFLSTHPGHDTRIRQLQDWMPEALTRYRNGPEAPVQKLPPVQ
ncbi:MAG: peptidase M48 [Nitrospirales bacterium]|nr:MAG: peptidase M48 [Nitrospirales bacterium]